MWTRRRFEPHYSEIRSADQVQIYETILVDEGQVTTSLLRRWAMPRTIGCCLTASTRQPATRHCRHGGALQDPAFTDAGHRVRYSVAAGRPRRSVSRGSRLWYEPIGYRWANNLKPYDAPEPRRFTSYYDAMANTAAVMLVKAQR